MLEIEILFDEKRAKVEEYRLLYENFTKRKSNSVQGSSLS